jgi:hypothetical protein
MRAFHHAVNPAFDLITKVNIYPSGGVRFFGFGGF